LFSCFAIQCFDPKSIKFQFPSRCGVPWYSYILQGFKLFPSIRDLEGVFFWMLPINSLNPFPNWKLRVTSSLWNVVIFLNP
jgi:hypothetical protein